VQSHVSAASTAGKKFSVYRIGWTQSRSDHFGEKSRSPWSSRLCLFPINNQLLHLRATKKISGVVNICRYTQLRIRGQLRGSASHWGGWDDAQIPCRHRPSVSRNVTLRVGWILETELSNGKYTATEVHVLKIQGQRMSTEPMASPCEQLNENWDFTKGERVTASQGKISLLIYSLHGAESFLSG